MREAPACDVLPDGLAARGTLYLCTLKDETSSSLCAVLESCRLAFEEPYPNVMAVWFNDGELGRFCDALEGVLSPDELASTRFCLFEDFTAPSPADLMRTRSLELLVDQVQGQWLVELLRRRRLLTYYQPIVRVTEPGQVFAYECLLRGRHENGSLIYPDRLFDVARATGMMVHLDSMARLTAIDDARRRRLEARVFINFNPTSIHDPVTCLEGTVAAARRSGLPPEHFVFEVVESERIDDLERLLAILEFYRRAGFRVALDDLGAGYSSLSLLARIKPDYVKLDMELMRHVDSDPYKGLVAAKVLELARELGIATVVEGIETPEEWQWAVEHGADYAQGFLFARPGARPPRSTFSAAGGDGGGERG